MPGSPGCIAAQGDGSQQFRKHIDECRRRMTEILSASGQNMATNRLGQWTVEQVEKGDKHDNKNNDAMGNDAGPQPTPASGAGAAEDQRAIGRAKADDWTVLPEDRVAAPGPERFNIDCPARGEGLKVELHEALSSGPGLRNRVMTPERLAVEKLSIGSIRDVGGTWIHWTRLTAAFLHLSS